MLKIGWHEFDISPENGQPMGGYWRFNKFIKGVRDPVFGNTLIISNDDINYALVVLDDLIFDTNLVQKMKEGIEKRTKIPLENITIHLNHTHSTSVTITEGTVDDYPFLLPEGWDTKEMIELTRRRREKLVKIVSAASEIAFQNLTPAQFGFKKGLVEGIGRNRNQPETGPVDNEVSVLRFDPKNGAAPVILTNFSTHPTIAPPDNCLVSGDLVGSTKATIRKILDPNIQILYTTGAAGDVSTRFTRKESSFSEVDRMGRMLGSEIVKITETISEFEDNPKINFLSRRVTFDVRKLPNVETAQRYYMDVKQQLEKAKQENKDLGYIKKLTENLEGAGVQLRLASMDNKEKMAFSQEKYQVEVQGLRINDVKIVFHPFELFSQIALNVKERSINPNVVIIGYSNNWLSYIPTQYAFDEHSYESFITLAAKGSDKVFENAFLDLINEL